MVDRPDLVLAAIPVLALGGPLLGRAVSLTESIAGVGGALSPIPFGAIGPAAALAVILGELLVVGHPGT